MSYTLENTDIVIGGWEKGISNNPYEGIADMRNIDTVTIPGEASVAMSTQAMNTQAPVVSTITVDHTTDIFTYDGVVPLEVNTAVYFTNSGGALPNGLTQYRAYYIKTTPTPTTFTISETAGGTQKLVSDNGSGVTTMTSIQITIPQFKASNVWVSAIQYRQYFIGDSKGRVWVLDSGILGNTNKWIYLNNRSTGGEDPSWDGSNTLSGLCAYQNYLWILHPNSGDYKSIIDWDAGIPNLTGLTNISNLFAGFILLSSSSYVGVSTEAYVATDNVMYICAMKKLAALSTIQGALTDSTYGGQYTFNVANSHSNTTGITTSGSGAISTVTPFFQSTDVGAIINGGGLRTNTIIGKVIDSKNATLSNDTASSSTTGSTFTIVKAYNFNNSALSLPGNDEATCLTELGGKLLVGGLNNYIYPWDKISTYFDFPIFISENHTFKMVTVNTTTYLFTGRNGRIFVTNGGNANFFWEVPDNLSKTVNPYFDWKDAIFNRNQLYFSFAARTNDNTTINEYGGLWTIDLNTQGARISNQLSHGTYNGYAGALLPNRQSGSFSAIANDGYGLFIGWTDGTNSNIDKGISAPYTSTQAYIDTDIIPVGQYLTKRTFQNVEYKLATPLVTGEAVTMAYRTNINGNYTDIPITQGGAVGDLSGIGIVNFENVQWIQLRITLQSTATTPSYCRLREIRIR